MSQIIVRMRHVVMSLAALGMMMFAIPAIFIVGPYIEAKFLPVLDEVTVENSVSSVGATFRPFGKRLRPACGYVSIAALVERPGSPAFLGTVMTESPYKGRSRPPGMQELGVWTVLDSRQGDSVTFQLRYRCHNQYDTVMLLGPWRVE